MIDEALSVKRKAANDDLQEIEIRSYLVNLPKEDYDTKKLRKIWMDMNIAENVIDFVLGENQVKKELNVSSFLVPASPQIEFDFSRRMRKDETPKLTKIGSPLITPVNYSRKTRRSNNFRTADRIEFIQMKKQEFESPDPELIKASFNSSLNVDYRDFLDVSSSSRFEITPVKKNTKKFEFPPVKFETHNWKGSSIYSNLSEVVIYEFDKMLTESHKTKTEVIQILNDENPINYDYNAKKSRTRADYTNTDIAEKRKDNNLASRRARNRKKYNITIHEYSVDYDNEENVLIDKEINWIKATVGNLEEMFLNANSEHTVRNLMEMRHKFGLK